MQFCSQFIAQFQPHLMSKVNVLRPKARRVWTKVHENGRPFPRNNFQRKCVAGLRQLLPRVANTPRQFECTRLITSDQVKQAIRRIPGFGVLGRS